MLLGGLGALIVLALVFGSLLAGLPLLVAAVSILGKRLVTSAALILFFAFLALSPVPTVEVEVLATALALGIAIETLIVRGLLARRWPGCWGGPTGRCPGG